MLDTHREEVRAVFDNFDLDGNGEMDTNELHNMLVNEMCIPMKKKDVAAIAKELDENGNGIIDFEEFLEWKRNRSSNSGFGFSTGIPEELGGIGEQPCALPPGESLLPT